MQLFQGLDILEAQINPSSENDQQKGFQDPPPKRTDCARRTLISRGGKRVQCVSGGAAEIPQLRWKNLLIGRPLVVNSANLDYIKEW